MEGIGIRVRQEDRRRGQLGVGVGGQRIVKVGVQVEVQVEVLAEVRLVASLSTS